MQIYSGPQRADPADLLEVQGVCGAITGWSPFAGADMFGYTAHTWKGLVPQSVLAARVDQYLEREKLTDRLLPHPAQRHHDVCHGIGVGLYHLGIKMGGR